MGETDGRLEGLVNNILANLIILQSAKTPLHMACQHISIVRLLLTKGADTTVTDKVRIDISPLSLSSLAFISSICNQ